MEGGEIVFTGVCVGSDPETKFDTGLGGRACFNEHRACAAGAIRGKCALKTATYYKVLGALI